MDRRLLALAAATLTVACAGHRATAPAPAAAPAQPAAAIAAAPAPARDPATLRYVAGTSRYRVEQTTHITQEVMGQVNTADVTSRQVISVVATAAADNLAFAVTLDSIDVIGPQAADLSSITAARGQTFRVVLAPSGLVVSVTAPDTTNLLLRQVAVGLREFFPRIAPPMAAGQAWNDSVTTVNSGDISVTMRAARQNHVVGWEDRDGIRALHLASASTYTVTGSGEAQGQNLELTGNGQSTRDSFISAAGLFLGSVESDSAMINANVTSVGLTVPIHQSRRSTVTRLP
jgi:hypothetical protein